MLPAIKSMYDDAMIVESLHSVIRCIDIVDVDETNKQWGNASSKIEDFIIRIANIDVDLGRKMLESWKAAKQENSDYRELSYRISQLSDTLKEALNRLYGPINIGDENYSFSKTPSGFLTVKSLKTGKYIHNPMNPMREAYSLAGEIYDPSIKEYHILGSGLGYLVYSIWDLSKQTAVIHLYEEDKTILEYAYQAGVLSWVDADHIIIEDFDNTEELLSKFTDTYIGLVHDHYVSDWKTGTYDSLAGSYMINHIDFNERTYRINKVLWTINENENIKNSSGTIEDFCRNSLFSGKEFVVVSAGPSLDYNIDFIRESVGKRVIISINTSLRRLEKEQIYPDMVVALDPRPELVEHIKGIEEFTERIPLIITSNASQTFTTAYRGKKYVVSDCEKTEDGFDWSFGGTVASFGLDIAYYLKASRVYLVGSDLAYTENRNYASGVSHSEKEGMLDSISVECTDGGMVETDTLYNKYRSIIEAQIRLHPEVTVINLAKHGAKIHGAETLTV